MNALDLWPRLDAAGYGLMRLLLGALWQSSILIIAIGGLAWLLRRRRAAVRHALWAGAIVALPLLPLLTGAILRAGAPQAPLRVLPEYEAPAFAEPLGPAPAAPLVIPVEAPSIARAEPAPKRLPISPRRAYLWAWLLLAYAAGLGGMLAWIAMGRSRIREWVRSAVLVIDERVLSAFAQARASVGLRGDFLVLESERVPASISCGLLHRVVLLPAGFTERLSDAELRALAVHELVHVRRRDPVVLLLVALVRSAFFFHPLVWLAARQVSVLSEQAADDAVLDAVGEPISYAKMLARLAERLPRHAVGTELGAGILLSKGAFLRRVEAILSERRDEIRRLTRRLFAVTTMAAFASLVLALAVPLAQKARGAEPGPAYEKARASKKLAVNVGGETFKVNMVVRWDRNGAALYEDGRGAPVTVLDFPHLDYSRQAPWMDIADILFRPAPKRYDLIELRVFDHTTRELLRPDGALAVGYDASGPLVQLRSVGGLLPESVDVWFRLVLRPEGGPVWSLDGRPGAVAELDSGVVTLRERHPGAASYTMRAVAGGPSEIEWRGFDDEENQCTIVLDRRGGASRSRKRYQLCAVTVDGRRVVPDYPHFVFGAEATVAVVLPLPADQLARIELRPFTGREVFYFDGVQLPRVSDRPMQGPPPVEVDVGGREGEFASDALAPVKVTLTTRRGRAAGGVEGGQYGGRITAPQGPVTDLDSAATVIYAIDGLQAKAPELLLLDENGRPVPSRSPTSRGITSGAAGWTVGYVATGVPLSQVARVRLSLGPVPPELPQADEAAADGKDYAAERSRYLALLARPELELRDGRAAIALFSEHEDWPALADAYEATAEAMWRVTHTPADAFIMPAPEEPVESERVGGGPYVLVQTNLDGEWSKGMGGPENWIPWLERKEKDLRQARVDMLLTLSKLCLEKLRAPGRAVKACEAAGRGVPICSELLELLIPQIWPQIDVKPEEVFATDHVGAAALRLQILESLAGAQEAAGDLDGAAHTCVRAMLAALIQDRGDWNAHGPRVQAEAFWRLVRKLPAGTPLPPTLWLTVLDREDAACDFPAPEDGPHGLPYSFPGPTLVVRPGLKATTLTVSADMETPGGRGGVRCYTMADGGAQGLGWVQWYPDARAGREWRTETFEVPDDVGVIRLEITPAAGNDFHVRELKVKATFAPEPER